MIELKTRHRKSKVTLEKKMVQIAIYQGNDGVRFESHIYPKDDSLRIQILVLSDKTPENADLADFLFELQDQLENSEVSIIDFSKIQSCTVLYNYGEINFKNLPYKSSNDYLEVISASR